MNSDDNSPLLRGRNALSSLRKVCSSLTTLLSTAEFGIKMEDEPLGCRLDFYCDEINEEKNQ